MPHPTGTAPQRWSRFLVTTATCGQGGSGRSRHCGGSALVPQAAAPHHVPPLAAGCPPPCLARAPGRGGGGGRRRGLCSRCRSAAAAARGPRPPCRPSLRPARQQSPQLRRRVPGLGSQAGKGPPPKPPSQRTQSGSGPREGPAPSPGARALRLLAARDLVRLSRGSGPRRSLAAALQPALVCQRVHSTHTHPNLHAPRGDSAGTARDPQSCAHALPPGATHSAPAPRSV